MVSMVGFERWCWRDRKRCHLYKACNYAEGWRANAGNRGEDVTLRGVCGRAAAWDLQLKRAEDGMNCCPLESLREERDCDHGWCACAWIRAMRRVEGRRSRAGPARNPAPVHTGSKGDPTAIRWWKRFSESNAARCPCRREFPKDRNLCFVL